MTDRSLLLCLSSDRDLLEIRRRVLATRYDVVPLSSLMDLKTVSSERLVDVLVLCHTLSGEECAIASAVARGRWPGIKILSIVTPYNSCQSSDVDGQVGSLDGPEELFEAIGWLLGTPRPVRRSIVGVPRPMRKARILVREM